MSSPVKPVINVIYMGLMGKHKKKLKKFSAGCVRRNYF